jgi:hypothetical protein
LAAYKTLLVEGELYLCVNFSFHFNQLGLKVFLIHLSQSSFTDSFQQ